MFAFHYATLRAAQWPPRDEAVAFDTHVLACALAQALEALQIDGTPVTVSLGLPKDAIIDVLNAYFPVTPRAGFALDMAPAPIVDMEEGLLRDLLLDHRAPAPSASPLVATWLASIVSRRAMQDDHLWQDLGLFERAELGRLLARHFPNLHAGNIRNMRWKKYFYRRLCEAEGFTLCTAPSCAVCTDFGDCFGDEDGMSRLALARREQAIAAA
ncbi:nitrogen fixation protein NifQ [Methyloraptor flagellatus]|uniref:Nitrogen fixation protein NifQ n=1 Tax=Methyloraptor flagellatus TaxID=3162530 RepID=A0AAU7XH24_9HYPH